MTQDHQAPGEVPGEIVIANEFAAVVVRKVTTRNGERLEIRSLGKDTSVRLDAIALEALTWSSALEVGRALETPLGPEGGQP
ncbi:MAG: dihydrodiol dehydrogenase [Actinomycetota bacterium]|nr:dihydrodiol dehydrogenase [Actinomycetota bacterium]